MKAWTNQLMTTRILGHIASAVLVATIAPSASSAAPRQARDAAAVLAVDEAWTDAEIRGDASFVDALLLPEYRSIGANGKITDKAAIVASSLKRGSHSDFGKTVAAYRATHPMRGDVVINGDTAILTWVSLVSGKGEPIASCDTFLYRGKRWRALYSQHSTAEM